jgi:hypothetical protein
MQVESIVNVGIPSWLALRIGLSHDVDPKGSRASKSHTAEGVDESSTPNPSETILAWHVLIS